MVPVGLSAYMHGRHGRVPFAMRITYRDTEEEWLRLQLSERDLYWIAGFLEGEGSFHFNGTATIRAVQVHLPPLLALQRLVGGTVGRAYPGSGALRTCHYWAWRARALGQLLLPLESPKRQEQILQMLHPSREAHARVAARARNHRAGLRKEAAACG